MYESCDNQFKQNHFSSSLSLYSASIAAVRLGLFGLSLSFLFFYDVILYFQRIKFLQGSFDVIPIACLQGGVHV